MGTKIDFKYYADIIEKKCQADDFIFMIEKSDKHDARFAVNMMTQHMKGDLYRVSISVNKGGKVGSASTNSLSEESILTILKRAEDIANYAPIDKEYSESPSADNCEEAINYSDSILNMEQNVLTDNIELCCNYAKKKEGEIAGLSSRLVHNCYIITKNGFEAEDTHTSYSHSMTFKKDKIETKVVKDVKDYQYFSIDDEISRLNDQYRALKDYNKIEKGLYNVILSPLAVMQFFSFMSYFMMDRRSADEGSSAFSGKINTKMFGDKFSLYSDSNDKALIFPKFNSKGVVNRSANFVDKGILKNLGCSLDYAKKKNISPVSITNTIIPGGNYTLQDMIKEGHKGLYINNFWYIRSVDVKKGEITGMTRDGVIYFENGELKHSVNNLRFNEIFYEVTKRILGLGESIPMTTDYRIPPMLIEDFNFVDVTNF